MFGVAERTGLCGKEETSGGHIDGKYKVLL